MKYCIVTRALFAARARYGMAIFRQDWNKNYSQHT
jgi:hypothetical protein